MSINYTPILNNNSIKVKVYWLVLIYTIIYIYYTVGKKIGDASFLVISGTLFVGLVLLINILAIQKFINIFNKKYIFLLVFILYFSLTGLLVTTFTKQLIWTSELLLFFTPLVIHDYFKQIKSFRINKILIYSILSILLIYSIKAIFVLREDPHAARDLISSGLKENLAIGGGFALAYSLSILVPCLFYLLVKHKKNTSRLERLFIIFCIVVYSISVFSSLFMISILLMLFGCLFSIFITKNNNSVFSLFFKGLFIALLFYFMFGKTVGHFLVESNHFSNSIIQQRVNEIGYSLIGKSDETIDLYTRTNTYEKSFFVFLENPFFGISYKSGYDYFDQYKYGLGGHSDFFDYLGKFGIIGSIPFFYFLFLSYKETSRSNVIKIAWLIFIIGIILNPIMSFTIFLVIFLLLPLIDTYTLNKVCISQMNN